MSKGNRKGELVPELRFGEFGGAWDEKELAFLCELKAGKFVRSSEINAQKAIGLFPCYGGNGLRGYTKSFTHTGSYSLIGRQGELCGNVTFALDKFHATEHAVVATPKGNKTNTKWLYYLLVRANLNQYATGQAQPGLSVKNLEKLRFGFPRDLKEQQKIANTLSSLDTLITAHTDKLTALREHKQGLLQQLFPGAGELVPGLRFGGFEGEWQEEMLAFLCELKAGKFVRSSEINAQKTTGLFPCYGGNGLRGYTKSFTNTGSYSLIGRQGELCGNVTFALDKFHATEHAVVATPNNKTNTKWLYYLLVRANLNQYATGQAQPGLSVKNLEKLRFKFPRDRKEQEVIADCLTTLDNFIAAQAKKIKTLCDHKKGLMQRLFPKPNGK